MTFRRAATLLLAASLLAAGRASAQGGPGGGVRTRMSLSATTITFPTPTGADLDNGYVDATGSITATIDARKAGGTSSTTQRTSTISIRATTATMGGTKPIGHLEWSRSDLGTWNGLTLSDVTVETRQFVFNTLNDPWTATVLFRTRAGWTDTPPATYSATVVFTLTITTP